MDASVLPSSTTQTLQRAIRTGKLDLDERLVGGDADSASEEENEGMQEVLELLRKGEVHNLGPDGNRIHAVPPHASSHGEKKQPSPSGTSPAAANNPQLNAFPPLNRPKTSKFKLSRSQFERPTPAATIPPSPCPTSQDHTPVSRDERSSPRLPAAMMPSVIERLPPTANATVKASPSSVTPTAIDSPSVLPQSSISALNATPSTSSEILPVVVNSPSFPKPKTASNSSLSTSSQAFPTVIDSPSFPKPELRGTNATTVLPLATSRLSRPPIVVCSTAWDSGSQERLTAATPPSFPLPSTGQSKPSSLILTNVKEADTQGKAATNILPKQEKKVSRFMAERM